MRVVFVAWRELAHPKAGGAEVLIDRLANGLADRGHDVRLMCGGPVGERSYPVIDLGGAYGQYLRAPIEHRRRFHDWDLLVDTETGLPFFSPLWRRRPVLCLVHHVHTEQWAQRFSAPLAAVGRGLESRIMPLLYRHVPFLAISPSTADALAKIGVPTEMITGAPLVGVEVPSVATRPEPDPLFFALGRLVPHKRIDLLLQLWPEIRRRTGGRLVIAGEGPERPRLEALCSEGAEMVGKITEADKWDLLSRSWALLHPAQHEGWGVVISEAAAAGTPTIGFDVPGVRDAVADGESGYLAESPADFVKYCAELACNHRRREAMGVAARCLADRCTWSKSIDAFETIATSVVTAGTRRTVARRSLEPGHRRRVVKT